MSAASTSFHRLNADRGLGLFHKVSWVVLNAINNSYRRNASAGLDIRHFSPRLTPSDWETVNLASSPSRVLSDLFWEKIDWSMILAELGEINICDIGCGSGNYALRLQKASGHRIRRYHGIDSCPHPQWKELMNTYDFINLANQTSDRVLDSVPRETNLFITQSAIEHFENDLWFFSNINQFIETTGGDTIQIHLFPSAACLKLYRLHGVRQYTPRTVSKITSLFSSPSSYCMLFELGGKHSNGLHYQFITKPKAAGRPEKRESEPAKYRRALIEAIGQDVIIRSDSPSFYALVIHSNYKGTMFQRMNSLNKASE